MGGLSAMVASQWYGIPNERLAGMFQPRSGVNVVSTALAGAWLSDAALFVRQVGNDSAPLFLLMKCGSRETSYSQSLTLTGIV